MAQSSSLPHGFERSLSVSLAVHIAVAILLLVGLPRWVQPLPPPSVPIPIEVVDIGELTNTRTREQPPAPPQQAEKIEPPKPAPPPPATQPEPPKPAEKPPEPKPAPPEKLEEALPKKAEKPKEPPKPKPPEPDRLASVLKNVAKLQPTPPTPTQDKRPTEAKPTQASNAPSLSDRLTISEMDALRRQLQQCWNVPIGARDIENMVVEIVIEINQDRTVRQAEVVDRARMATDQFFRTAAEAALRALYNPLCSPLMVPEDKYDQWRVTRLFFNPRDML